MAALSDRGSGDGEDLTDQEQTQASVLAVAFFKYLFLVLGSNADAVVLVNDDHRVPCLLSAHLDAVDMLAMAHGIVDQVVRNLQGQRIDQDLHPSGPFLPRHPLQM